MAVFVKRIVTTPFSTVLQTSLKPVLVCSNREHSNHRNVQRLPKRYIRNHEVKGKADSLSSKGFLRNIVPYQPPVDAEEVTLKMFRDIIGTDNLQYTVNNDQKFQLLAALNGQFSYMVPNSLLYALRSLGDILEFYLTPVDHSIPYDKLKQEVLPPNLHILYEYHRFHPDTDTMFGGISAFPKSSTIVSGLKTKEKYKGYDAESPWHDI